MALQTTCKKCQKRVQASCRLSRGNLWTEAELKRIGKSCQDIWGHDHKSIRTEMDCILAEDHNSFEMQKMMVRTDQLFSITKAIGSKIYTSKLEAETHGRAKTVVLLLKQYNAHYYCFYKKGTTRAMVGLQGLHMNDAF